jgi:hypothetical protein
LAQPVKLIGIVLAEKPRKMLELFEFWKAHWVDDQDATFFDQKNYID